MRLIALADRQSMPDELWMWDVRAHPKVARVFATPAAGPGWCDSLEAAPTCPTVGKVLCACVAAAIAREVLAACPVGKDAAGALELLARWIDDPTDERFRGICALLFGEVL